MRRMLSGWILCAVLASVSHAQTMDWELEDSDTDVGSHAIAIVEQLIDGEWVVADRHSEQGSEQSLPYENKMAHATAWFEDNVCTVRSQTAAGYTVFGNYTKIWAGTWREHIGQTGAPEFRTVGETYGDAKSTTKWKAKETGVMTAHLKLNPPPLHPAPPRYNGPEPDFANAALRVSCGQSSITAVFDTNLWAWEVNRTLCKYNVDTGQNNVTTETDWIFGWRSLEEMYIHTELVSANQVVDVEVGSNSEGWEFANAIVSYIQGSLTVTSDEHDSEVKLFRVIIE